MHRSFHPQIRPQLCHLLEESRIAHIHRLGRIDLRPSGHKARYREGHDDPVVVVAVQAGTVQLSSRDLEAIRPSLISALIVASNRMRPLLKLRDQKPLTDVVAHGDSTYSLDICLSKPRIEEAGSPRPFSRGGVTHKCKWIERMAPIGAPGDQAPIGSDILIAISLMSEC